MIVIELRYICSTCNITVSCPQRAAPGAHVEMDIPQPPTGWTATDDGCVHCPAHPPRIVEPVAAMPNLKVVQ